jgi:hypothetical protein
MAFTEKIAELWRRQSRDFVSGWVTAYPQVATPLPPTAGRYLKVTCMDFGLRYDRDRMANRAPVFASQVVWPFASERITITKTLGPSSFQALHSGDFLTTVVDNVGLTDLLPLESGSVDITAALMSAPQSTLLGQATSFLDDLSELTQVPQLTAAAPIARKIADGVDRILGNDETTGLIGFTTTVDAAELHTGYYAVTTWPTGGFRDANGYLAVQNGHLTAYQNNKWAPAEGFDYILIRIAVYGQQPLRWKSIPSITDLWEVARAKLSSARSTEMVEDAASAILVAVDRAEAEPNLCTADQKDAAKTLMADYHAAYERRAEVLRGAPVPTETVETVEPGRGDVPPQEPATTADLQAASDVLKAGDLSLRRLEKRMQADSRHAHGRGLVR